MDALLERALKAEALVRKLQQDYANLQDLYDELRLEQQEDDEGRREDAEEAAYLDRIGRSR